MTRVPRAPLAVRVLGSPPLAAIARRATRRSLRVLAYHDVSDATRFTAHVEHLRRHYQPVSGAAVAAWLHQGATLPERAVWVTFDDGYRTVFELAAPLLRRRGIPATAFVCPGVLSSSAVHWWDTVHAAVPRAHQLVHRLQRVDDERRRSIVAALRSVDPARSRPTDVATLDDLRRWCDDGFEIGNHTWDHPALDQCDDSEQRRQIVDAACWLDRHLDPSPRPFAFPHGHGTAAARGVLTEIGCPLAVMYDHRLAARRDPFAVSRLRVGAADPVWRLEAALAGGQPALLAGADAVLRRVRRPGSTRRSACHDGGRRGDRQRRHWTYRDRPGPLAAKSSPATLTRAPTRWSSCWTGHSRAREAALDDIADVRLVVHELEHNRGPALARLAGVRIATSPPRHHRGRRHPRRRRRGRPPAVTPRRTLRPGRRRVASRRASTWRPRRGDEPPLRRRVPSGRRALGARTRDDPAGVVRRAREHPAGVAPQRRGLPADRSRSRTSRTLTSGYDSPPSGRRPGALRCGDRRPSPPSRHAHGVRPAIVGATALTRDALEERWGTVPNTPGCRRPPWCDGPGTSTGSPAVSPVCGRSRSGRRRGRCGSWREPIGRPRGARRAKSCAGYRRPPRMR